MDVLFVAGFGPIIRDRDASREFYEKALGLPLEGDDDYRHTGNLDGVKHFALWELSGAAESCFGRPEWPADVPIPSAWIEFDVANMAEAIAALQARGYRLLVADRKEPWGQIVTRLLSPEGLLVGVTITPGMREELKAD